MGGTHRSSLDFLTNSRGLHPNQDVDLDKLIHIRLTETNTFSILDLASTSVSNEYNDEAASVRYHNLKYEEVCFKLLFIVNSH